MSDASGDPAAALVELVAGKSDDELNQLATDLGVETLLGQIFAGMQQAFVPDKAVGVDATVQWDITAADGVHSWHVAVSEGACAVGPGPADAPRVTLGQSLPDFLRFIAGELDGMQAFMSGKLRLSGDLMFAQTMQGWFARG